MSGFQKYNDSRLDAKIDALKGMTERENDSVFMRMLHEIQTLRMELEQHKCELGEAKHELDEIRDNYSAMYDFAPMAYITFDVLGAILDMNLAAAKLFGKDKLSLLGKPFVNFLASHEHSRFLACVSDSISGIKNGNIEFELVMPDGKSKKILTSSVTAQIKKGDVDSCNMALIDVTERRISELNTRLTANLLDSLYEGVMLTDAQQRVIAVNAAYLRSTGYASDEVIGYTPSIMQSAQHDEAFYREMNTALTAHDGWQGEIWNRRKNGDIYRDFVNIKSIRNRDGDIDCYMAIFADGMGGEAVKMELDGLAYYDELTGLANRGLLYDRLQHELLQSRREGGLIAVLFLDLNFFNNINFAHGLGTRDHVIKQAAERLTYCLRAGDTLSRLEGEEFVAVLKNIADIAVPAKIAERVVKALEKPFLIDSVELHITTSVGISVSPVDGDEVSVLLKNADTAMFMAREQGRSNYRYYEGAMDKRVF